MGEMEKILAALKRARFDVATKATSNQFYLGASYFASSLEKELQKEIDAEKAERERNLKVKVQAGLGPRHTS